MYYFLFDNNEHIKCQNQVATWRFELENHRRQPRSEQIVVRISALGYQTDRLIFCYLSTAMRF